MNPIKTWSVIFRVSGFFLLAASASNALGATVQGKAVSYNREIRPILSDNCFFCHGPDQNKRKGKMRLDVREDALAKKAFVPGKPDESELVRRIFTPDQDDLMPPPESHKKLSKAQKDLLRRWVAEGAKYEGHWAYIPPVKPPVSDRNAIDSLVRDRLRIAGLKPSPQADRRTLARRLYFDLTGLPPKPEEVEAFEKDRSPNAWTGLVERLLSSPQYGERMAVGWLDIVRFADTIGYHSDNPRNVWPYRDYVIKSINDNKPFDQFTREQIAGDLLPKSGLEQKVGSAFNRLLLSTEEGGAQAKDYEVRMLTDRVRAVSAVWLGQTVGCAQCHDHKFDPITQRDFYSLGAFFADIKEPILGRREDGMLVPNESQAAELARLESALATAQSTYDGPHPELSGAFANWLSAQQQAISYDRLWTALKPARMESSGGATLAVQDDSSILAKDKKPEKDSYTLVFTNVSAEVAALRLEALPDGSLPSKGPGRSKNGNFVLTEIVASVQRGTNEPEKISFAFARATIEQTTKTDKSTKVWTAAAAIDGDESDATGWAVLPDIGKPQWLVLELAHSAKLETGDRLTVGLKQNHGRGNHTLGRFRLSTATPSETLRSPLHLPPPAEIAEIVSVAEDKRTSGQSEKLFGYFKSIAPEASGLRDQVASARKAKTDYEAALPHCLISTASDQPRTVRLLPRGNWMIDTGDIMKPALPAYLTKTAARSADSLSHPKGEGRLPSVALLAREGGEGSRLTRLDLAEWLVSRDNPLTARVIMNRLWKQFFGIGLSKVLDDLGAQGEPPPNAALLDWLACEFMESGWDLKHMVRLITTSKTYQQVSLSSKQLRARDPFNRELAAQGRWRLEAEFVRDNALAISGLLVPKIGGPSVKPYQPDGYWENLNFPTRTYDASKNEDQYRRGLYTWWQRSFMHPSMLAFDAPSREECTAERNRSNIPQQALALLNDPTYVEASRAFATRIVQEGGRDTKARLAWAWRQALSRRPRRDEIKTLEILAAKELKEYRQNAEAAKAFLSVGFAPIPTDVDPAELAAWTSVARVILNLHETITRS